MIVERQDDEIIIRISAGNKATRIQSILDYLRYIELTSSSKATEKDVSLILNKAKKGRLNKIRKETGLNG